jgi:hypothetical protein
MFFFQSMFQQVYSGITGSTTLITVQTIAESILLLAILFALYEAYARAGDMRALALAGIRYLIMSLIISQYPNVFHNVNNAFNSVAAAIAPTDVLTNYRSQVANYLSSPSGQGAWWNIVTGDIAGALSLVFQLVAVFIFPITYVLFSFFYSMYGAVLYVCGPLVLALYPAFGMGQLARTYMVNMLIWNVWGIIYAIMSQLLTIMSADSLTSIFTAQNFGGAFQGASQMLLISLSSILISLIIALIPFIAKRVVSGDVGSTLFAVVSAAAAAVQTAAVAMAGMSAGGAASRGPIPIHLIPQEEAIPPVVLIAPRARLARQTRAKAGAAAPEEMQFYPASRRKGPTITERRISLAGPFGLVSNRAAMEGADLLRRHHLPTGVPPWRGSAIHMFRACTTSHTERRGRREGPFVP